MTTSGVVVPGAEPGPPSIGRPIDNAWACVVDRRLKSGSAGRAGELIVGGRGLANGYWTSAREARTRSRRYRTGDGFIEPATCAGSAATAKSNTSGARTRS